MSTAVTSYDSMKNLAEVIRERSGEEGGITPRAFAQEVAKLDLSEPIEYTPQHYVDGNVIIDRQVFEDVANVIRHRGGTNEGITPADFAETVAGLTDAGGMEDPEVVYIETRPLDWLKMPVPSEDEAYLLLQTDSDADQTYDLYMTTTGTYHPRVSYGTSVDGKFVETEGSLQQLDTTGKQNEKFTITIPNSAFTEVEGGKQVLLKVSRMTQVSHLGYFQDTDSYTPTEATANLVSQIVEIDCDTPHLCGVGALTTNAHYISIRACTHDNTANHRLKWCLRPWNATKYLYFMDTTSGHKMKNVWVRGNSFNMQRSNSSDLIVCEFPTDYSESTYYGTYSDLQYGFPGDLIRRRDKGGSYSTVGHIPNPFDIALGQNLLCVRNFDLSQQNSAHCLFAGCTNLRALPELDTLNVIDFAGMFYKCAKLRGVPTLAHAKGLTFHHMFADCTALKTVQNWAPNAGLYYDYMFYNCSSLENAPTFKLTGYTNEFGREIPGTISTDYMFGKCSKITSIPAMDLSKVFSIDRMFYGTGITSLAITVRSGQTFQLKNSQSYTSGYRDFRTGGTPTIKQLCAHCTELADVSNVVLEGSYNCTELFAGTSSLRTPPDMSNVIPTSMEKAFAASGITTAPRVSEQYADTISWKNAFNREYYDSGWTSWLSYKVNGITNIDLSSLLHDVSSTGTYTEHGATYTENTLYCRDGCDVYIGYPDYMVADNSAHTFIDGGPYYAHATHPVSTPSTPSIPESSGFNAQTTYSGARFLFVPDEVYQDYATDDHWNVLLDTTSASHVLDGVYYDSYANLRYRALWPESQYELAKATWGVEVPADISIEVVDDPNGLIDRIETPRFYAWMAAHGLSFTDQTLKIVSPVTSAYRKQFVIEKSLSDGSWASVDDFSGTDDSIGLSGIRVAKLDNDLEATIHITGTL